MVWLRSAGYGGWLARAFTAASQHRRAVSGADRKSDDALTREIRGVLAASPFHGEGHRKVWARLRYAGTRTSMRRVLRLMRQNICWRRPGLAHRGGRATMTAPSFPTRSTRCRAVKCRAGEFLERHQRFDRVNFADFDIDTGRQQRYLTVGLDRDNF
jgi:hypothetical protein